MAASKCEFASTVPILMSSKVERSSLFWLDSSLTSFRYPMANLRLHVESMFSAHSRDISVDDNCAYRHDYPRVVTRFNSQWRPLPIMLLTRHTLGDDRVQGQAVISVSCAPHD